MLLWSITARGFLRCQPGHSGMERAFSRRSWCKAKPRSLHSSPLAASWSSPIRSRHNNPQLHLPHYPQGPCLPSQPSPNFEHLVTSAGNQRDAQAASFVPIDFIARRNCARIRMRREPIAHWTKASSRHCLVISKGNNDPVTKELARLAMSDAQSQLSTSHETVGNVDLTQYKRASGQSAYDRWLELSGYGLREAFQQRMQSSSYQNGSDGDSWYTASARANMLREVQQRFQDKAVRLVLDEYPKLREAMHEDRQNKVDVRTGRQLPVTTWPTC
jgi:hypothetical protein